MNHTLKKLPKNLIEIEVTLDPEEVKNFYQEALAAIGRETTVSGFRTGKAPLELVEKQVGKIKILETAAEEAVHHTYHEIIEKEKIKPIDQPKVELLKLAPDNPLSFKLTIALRPKIKICDYKKITVQAKPSAIGEAEVDKVLKELQQMRRKESLAERPAQRGDRVEIDLEMFSEKAPIEGGQGKNISCVVGEEYYIPGLSDNLIGLKRGAKKEFPLRYPVNHHDKNFAGRLIDFKIEIKNVYQIDLPAINDDFAKNLGNFKTVADLRQQLRKNLTAEADLREKERQEIEILKQLVEKSEFEELPEVLVENELDKVIDELKLAIEQQNLKFEDYLSHLKKTIVDLRKEFSPKAEERVKVALSIHEIADKEKIEVSDKEIGKEIERISLLYKNEPDALDNLKSEAGRTYLKNMLLNRKVIEYLRSKIIIK